jgi:hypothetical protein
MAFGAIAGGILGAIAGGAGSPTSQNSTSSVNLRDFNDLNKGSSGLENAAYGAQLNNLSSLTDLVNAGPGTSAVGDANQATNQYANMLQQFLGQGGLPNQQQIGQANNYANQIFAPQQEALKQSFYDQNIQNSRLAAKLGRPVNDPILANKLAFEQTRQQQMLGAQRGAFAADFANQLPGRQLDLASAFSNVRQGLASQAFQNRQALLTMGQQLTNSERQYRLNAAGRTTNTTGSSGGGLGGMIGGAFAGVGAMAGVSKLFGNKNPGGDDTQLPASNPSSSSLFG